MASDFQISDFRNTSIGFDEITSLSCFATLLPIALADFDEVVLGKDLGKVLSWAKI